MNLAWGIFGFALLGILLSSAIAPIIIRMVSHWGLVDVPGKSAHKQHARPTPLAGGTILVVAYVIIFWLGNFWREHMLQPVFLGGLIIYVFGFWDDKVGLSAFPKLIGQILGSSIIVIWGNSIQLFGNIFTSLLPLQVIPWLDILITFFWLIGVTNAMNMIDSMDGLATGLGVVFFGFISAASMISSQPAMTLLGMSLFGICITLYFLNSTPAHFFLGDSGSQLLGFLSASLALIYAPDNLNPLSTWFVPILLLFLPIFDTTMVVFSRLYHRQPVYKANMDHLYHRLMSLKISPARSVMSVHLASIILGCIAFLVMYTEPILSNGVFILILFCSGLTIYFFIFQSDKKIPKS